MNHNTYSGRLVADTEIKLTQSGKEVVRFTLAVRRPHVKDVTDFINFEAWGSVAQYINKYTRKGSVLFVEGYYKIDKYQDKNGNTRYAHTIVVESAESPRTNESGGGSPITLPNESFNTEQNRGVVGVSNFEELSSTDSLPF